MVAAGLPLAIALIGLGISSGGLIVLLANVVDVPDWTTAVSGLIGIGVGIDYSLLVLTRFRAAMNDGKDRHDAVVEAVTTAGRSVIIAGCTVVIAVLGLCLTGLPYMYGVAISASLAVLVVMLAAITLLPALLSYLGPEGRPAADPVARPAREDRGRRRGVARRALEPRRPAPALDGGDRRHGGAARARRAGARHAPRLPRRRQRPARHDDPPGLRPEHRGLRARHQRPARDRRRAARPGGARPTSTRLRSGCAATGGVAFVADPRINQAGDAALVTVIPTTSPQDKETEDLVNRLRDDVVPAALGGSGVTAEDRRRDRGARGPERLHEGPHAAVHRRRRRPLVPAAAASPSTRR